MVNSGLTSSLRMPSCTVITMASSRSMSSFVFRAIPLAEFCNHTGTVRSCQLWKTNMSDATVLIFLLDHSKL